jgi:hypothetical protein
VAAEVGQERAAAKRLDTGHLTGDGRQDAGGRLGVLGEEAGAGEMDAMEDGGTLVAAVGALARRSTQPSVPRRRIR